MSDASMDAYLRDAQKHQCRELIEWLRIPSISTLAEHRADVAQAGEWLARHLQQIGLEHVRLIDTPGHPLVYADWLHAGPNRPTVLIYGHYDVQPVDPLVLWETPPFEPVVKSGPEGDDLYARGAADDKGQVFAHVKAIEALLAIRQMLPVNVKLIIEGEEEVGSPSLLAFVPEHPDLLAADVCLISDTNMRSPQLPVIIYGLRGLWTGELTVTGPSGDLHSGSYGGIVHNPAQALCELLAALHDEQGRVTVPGFYDNVPGLADSERDLLAQVPFGEAELLAETGVPAAYGEPGYSLVERRGARPTLEINGIWGGFTEDGFKTVIPGQARAKISCRLVPNQDPDRIGDLIKSYLQEVAPASVTLHLEQGQGGAATVVDLDVPAMGAAVRAYQRGFGANPIFSREGGSIPVVPCLQSVLQAPVVLMGFGLPDDNLHAPNEKFHLPNLYRGIRTSIAFLDEMASLASAG
jgi:acetylornithine deacetylase/succinyl-diaminopimelate desuccinylase-like protein